VDATIERTRKGVDELNLNVVAQGNVAMMNKARHPVPTKLAKDADSALKLKRSGVRKLFNIK